MRSCTPTATQRCFNCIAVGGVEAHGWAVFTSSPPRLIVGSPELIAKLLRERLSAPQRSIRDVIDTPRGTHIRNHNCSLSRKRKRGAVVVEGEAKYVYERASLGDHCKPIEGPSPTVLSKAALVWVTKSGDGRAHSRLTLNPRESALLQTFPLTYWLPASNRLALKQVANAVPPRVATLLMNATAVGECGMGACYKRSLDHGSEFVNV